MISPRYRVKQIRDAHLYKFHTMASILDKLDVIECLEIPGRKPQIGEILDKQRELYVALGIDPPTSL